MQLSEGKKRLRFLVSAVTFVATVATLFYVGVTFPRFVENAFENLLFEEQPNTTYELDFNLFLKRAGKMREYRVTGSEDRGVLHLKLSSSRERTGKMHKYEVIDNFTRRRVMIYEVDQPLADEEVEVLVSQSEMARIGEKYKRQSDQVDQITRTPYFIAVKWLLLVIASGLPGLAIFSSITITYWVMDGFRKG